MHRGGLAFGFPTHYPYPLGPRRPKYENSAPNRNSAVDSSDWVNITLSGQAHAVASMIHLLHRLNVIAASEWSPPVTLRDSAIVIRVAARGMRTQ